MAARKYFVTKCWRHDGFDAIHYFNAAKALHEAEINAMNNELYQVFKHPAPTKNAKWCVQFRYGICSYRTKAIASAIASAAKKADDKNFTKETRQSYEFYNQSDRESFSNLSIGSNTP